ncbi:gastrula zinc finger protein XlCGF57.1-like [Dunckerocampus dactyliophorus]|uniref:gastrula zinc finger protein XlCGF57.1-like n=1 Tax=Dunckerocampus dactyliophorus TaxID=161453 RepID=UPI002405B17F|nr:gastrula zinc finger protein XlCGF57.1-like [Dunckerocampus dactyliophorus]
MDHSYAKMATSCQREGGRESAPPTPSKSSTEKKPQTADNDIQKLIARQEECPTLKQEDAQAPHVKEEEEELWTTQVVGQHLQGPEEADLTKLPLNGVSVKTEDHEDKPPESSCWSCPSDVQQLIGHQEEHPTQLQRESSTLKREDPQLPHIKEEKEELWITQERECLLRPKEAEFTKLPLTVVSVKTEDHEDKPPESSQLHHSPSEENRGAEPPSSSSPQHMTTEAGGDHCGGSQADNVLAPLSDSDDTTSDSPEDEGREDSSDTDWEVDMRTHTDNKHSKCSKRKTGKRNVTCSVCDKSFVCKSELTKHMRRHTGEKPFGCSSCAKSFFSKSDLTRHMVTHTGEKPFGCSVCAKTFSRKSSLTQHMLTHTGEKPFCCSVCGKSFLFQRDVTQHMRTHTGEKPYSCSVCGKLLSQRSSVVSHMRTHTGEKPFCCSVCAHRFSQKANLVSHMRMHTGQKPFLCSVCGKSYYSQSSFTYHMLKHTGEKVFSCPVCGKRFLQKDALPRHMRTHTGEKPFSCSVCGKQFVNKSSIMSHMKTHNGEKPI